jgi:ubiquinone/menaquinone biosynthesis C-methylase UbiE
VTGAAARRLAALVAELARTSAAGGPPPRGLPYLGLEHASGTSLHLLDALAAHGIFRKYELVLQVGAGLGGHARWMTARLGCTVVGTTATAGEAAAGEELTQRSAARGHVRLLPADPRRLPLAAARFTHVWLIEALAEVRVPEAALREACRVVRPGGLVAVQELVAADGTPPALPGRRALPATRWRAPLVAAGLADVEARDVTAHAVERSARVTAARARLLERLRDEPTLQAVAAAREALGSALAGGALRVVQVVGRRPG